jgi:uncharacterized protein YggE
MKAFAIALLAAVLVVGVALSGIGRPQDARGGSNQDQSERTITVTGNGSVRAVPDSAQFSFGVTTQAVNATDALRNNATLARKVIAAVKGAGIPDADIQTETVFLTPRLSDEGSLIVGYTATNSISTALRDLSKTGTVVDAAVEAGATDVSGPSLSRSNQADLYRTALRDAMADARAKAQSIANASGASLGAVSSVVEGSAAPVPLAMTKTADSAAEPTPIEPGTETVEAVVTAEFVLG